MLRKPHLFPLLFCCFMLVTGCGGSSTDSLTTAVSTSSSCGALAATFSSAQTCQSTGTCPGAGVAWSPSVTGASNTNHDASVVVTQTVSTQSGPIIGLAQPAPASAEVTFTIDMTEDLGEYGSLTLEAEVQNFPSANITGTAYPLLVYLSDGVNDFINLPRGPSTAGDCATSGYYSCSGSVCSPNPGCSPAWPSAYFGREQWEQHQVTNNNPQFSACGSYPSVNVFPTCNWTGGNTPPNDESPGCAFNETFFPGSYATPRLRYGGIYTAKYVMIASDFASLSGEAANLQLKVIKKADANSGGAVDLNVILVGDQNVNDSRTGRGQQNLNLLFQNVYNIYSQTSTNVKLGKINAIEWPSAQGGEPYANIDVSEIGFMFASVAPLYPASSVGRAINLFLVSTLPESAGTLGGLTVLGVSGAIGGPTQQDSANSGTVISTFSELGTFNQNCTVGGSCPETSQDAGFVLLGQTIAHELGHYLGLNHPSEADGTIHDQVYDTPICTATDPSLGYISINSCMIHDASVDPALGGSSCNLACGSPSGSSSGIYCPTAPQCQFNYIMWWTSKRYDPSTNLGDGDLFSGGQGQIVNYSSYVQ
ncbi:MAG: hypothetical protein P4M08_03940 [Oligoflexia bacterium]|nr:hypothetical protein [Oligoflexia bacterium]